MSVRLSVRLVSALCLFEVLLSGPSDAHQCRPLQGPQVFGFGTLTCAGGQAYDCRRTASGWAWVKVVHFCPVLDPRPGHGKSAPGPRHSPS